MVSGCRAAAWLLTPIFPFLPIGSPNCALCGAGECRAKPAREQLWTTKPCVYDRRTDMPFMLKTNPLKRADLDEFVECHNPANRHRRKATWSEEDAAGRWRAFEYDELLKRDKVNLDLFWLKRAPCCSLRLVCKGTSRHSRLFYCSAW
jgi:hypothetical protein